ncbi:unnamed protein product [Vicia faba]|uniref:BURP domain-containing protein n=1 Tax=Vicia faba TaxID=3906 RepID=A0AAV1A6U6_VICFA|nr:unnamed protein product [Vicia faba]
MVFHFFHIITFLMLVIVATNAETLPPQLYWKSVLPNSPMPKAITNLLPNSPFPKPIINLLLPGEDLGVKKDYSDGGEADVKSVGLSNSQFYIHAASEHDVNSRESPNVFRYQHDASEHDVNSRESPNVFRYQHDASEHDVNSRESPNVFRYQHDASEHDVNSRESPNVFRYQHDASEHDVNSRESPNVFRYQHDASEHDVNSRESPNVFRYQHDASAHDVNSRESPNVFRYQHDASEHDVNSRESPNVFRYQHDASEHDVNSRESPNVFRYQHDASEPDVNSGESLNAFNYKHVASEPDVNSRESSNAFSYKHTASEPDVNSRESPNAFNYKHAASDETQLHDKPKALLFFFEKNLHDGTKSNLQFFKTSSSNVAKFLPKEVANSIPFSSNKVDYILNKMNIKKGSKGARIVKNTISECEEEGIKGEEKLCVTSLESMIDFVTSKLGKNVEAFSTEMNKESESPQYKMIAQGVKKLGDKNKVVVCHKVNYPYAVFYCHKTETTKAYSVPLEGVDGIRVKAIVVCHTDTSQWNPKHLAFQVLKIKPGNVPVCHLLPKDNVVWISK